MNQSREYTTDEIREQFMNHVRMLIEYWDNVDRQTTKEKIEGFAHSLLATIDGSSMDLPGFILAPAPHHEDKQYYIDKGENYYPENQSDSDIAGYLHEILFRKE
jgi:hypothetical protein